MREIIGTLDLKTLNIDRDQFSKKVVQSADLDMDKLGIEILSFNIQSVTDEKGLIEDLGADNTALIKKNASITKAEADKEVAIATAQAQKAANDARVEAERAIAEKNNELAIIKAELKVKEDTKKANADAAYEIQRQEQMKVVNEKTVEAEIAQTQKEQVLAQERVKVTENELRSTINVKADAEKYRTQTNADAQKYQIEIDAAAELERRKRRAEAETYEAERAAEAQKAKADAMKFEMEQKALGIKAEAEAKAYGIEKCGIAEAEAIKLKGLAEAEAMEKKAEAFEKYGNAAIIEMMTKVLPEVAAKVAEPISAVRDITIYGGDCSTVAGNVPSVMKQSMDVLTSVTGVDMTEVVKAQTAVNKTITVDGDVLHEVNKRSKK
jgi:flotillin